MLVTLTILKNVIAPISLLLQNNAVKKMKTCLFDGNRVGSYSKDWLSKST